MIKIINSLSLGKGMNSKRFNFRIKAPSTAISLLLLAMTQLPAALNETLKTTCILTTWSDYKTFWAWNEIPLDSRIRFCNGSEIIINKTNQETKETVTMRD